MTRTTKTAIVIGGYVAAIAAGVLAAQLYDWEMARKPYDTSGGMYAGGEMLQSLAAFCSFRSCRPALAVVPAPAHPVLERPRDGVGRVRGGGSVAVLLQMVMRGPAPVAR
jgi:hypothetical protein